MSASDDRVVIELPDWARALDPSRRYESDGDRIALAIELARQNVLRGTGGPFGAAIFDDATSTLVSVGMNLVVSAGNSTLHAEMVAFQMAQRKIGSHSLSSGGRQMSLFTSCEPCAMCFGATLWSGVRRLVSAATAADARAIGFDEGPVFEESWRYLESAGIGIERQLMRAEGKRVLDDYAARGGVIYNGR